MSAFSKIVVLATLLLLPECVAAQNWGGWELREFRSTLDVAEDGSAVVLELFGLRATGAAARQDFHGLRRLVAVRSRGPLGTRRSLFLKVVTVSDGAGHRLPYSQRIWNGQLEVRVPLEARPGESRTVEISYLVRNAVRHFEDHDEIFWDLTGSRLPRVEERASAMVMLPDQVGGRVRAQGYVGGAGGGPLTAEVKGATVRLEASRPIAAQQAFSVDVVVPKGIFRQPSWPTRAGWFLVSNAIVLLPLPVYLLMLGVRRLKGGAPPVAVVTEYEPPPGLTPAEAGTLMDDRVDPRDITATLFDLAVRGYVKIEEDQSEGHPDYVIRLLKPREQWHGLKPYEISMLFNTFYGGHWTKLSSLRLRFAVALPPMRTGIMSALIEQGFYRVDPQSAQGYRVAGLVLLALVLLVAQSMGWISLFQSGLPALLAVVISAAIVFAMGRKLSAKSLKGMRAFAEVEGFREFLERVDADRLARVAPQQLERCLPYAMALGVEHKWAEQFAGIAREVPEWFQMAGEEGFNPSLWTRRLGSMADHVQVVFSSLPRSRRHLRAEREEASEGVAARN